MHERVFIKTANCAHVELTSGCKICCLYFILTHCKTGIISVKAMCSIYKTSLSAIEETSE